MKRNLLFALGVSFTNAQCWQDTSASINSYNVGIKNDDTLRACGRNIYGNYPNGTIIQSNVPI